MTPVGGQRFAVDRDRRGNAQGVIFQFPDLRHQLLPVQDVAAGHSIVHAGDQFQRHAQLQDFGVQAQGRPGGRDRVDGLVVGLVDDHQDLVRPDFLQEELSLQEAV